jgi:hypothetical protein
MFSITHDQLSKIAAVGAFVALSAVSIPAHADELAQNLGPVGPHEPILTSVGSRRVIAFYEPGSDHCALQAVIWDNTNADTDMSAARIRVSLEPGQIVHIDNAEHESLNLQCGRNADNLAVVDTPEYIAFGASAPNDIKASAAGF